MNFENFEVKGHGGLMPPSLIRKLPLCLLQVVGGLDIHKKMVVDVWPFFQILLQSPSFASQDPSETFSTYHRTGSSHWTDDVTVSADDWFSDAKQAFPQNLSFMNVPEFNLKLFTETRGEKNQKSAETFLNSFFLSCSGDT